MVSFEIFVKAMPPSLSELKVLPSFCYAFKIPDDRAVTIIYIPLTYSADAAHAEQREQNDDYEVVSCAP